MANKSSYSAKAARKGKDIGKCGKNFSKIEAKARSAWPATYCQGKFGTKRLRGDFPMFTAIIRTSASRR